MAALAPGHMADILAFPPVLVDAGPSFHSWFCIFGSISLSLIFHLCQMGIVMAALCSCETEGIFKTFLDQQKFQSVLSQITGV